VRNVADVVWLVVCMQNMHAPNVRKCIYIYVYIHTHIHTVQSLLSTYVLNDLRSSVGHLRGRACWMFARFVKTIEADAEFFQRVSMCVCMPQCQYVHVYVSTSVIMSRFLQSKLVGENVHT
jgi:hypothetical protein